ncbi:hypothetical protein HOI71_22570, partial [Candidatus Poribacteria bacterium]|nr:hypothetical protein [Candidatus Poribacteria bacterium]
MPFPQFRPVAVAVLVAAVAVCRPALAQGLLFGGAADKVTLEVVARPSSARVGEAVEVSVTATIEPGWHIYSMTPSAAETGPQPTEIGLAATVLTRVGAVRQSTPMSKMDEAFAMVVELFEGEATFSQTMLVEETAAVGTVEIAATVRFMACDDRVCLPPTTVEATGALTVDAGPPRDEYLPAAAPPPP